MPPIKREAHFSFLSAWFGYANFAFDNTESKTLKQYSEKVRVGHLTNNVHMSANVDDISPIFLYPVIKYF